MSAMETDAAVGVDALSSAFDDASAMTGDAAIAAFAAILAGHADRDADDTGVRLKEESIYALTKLYAASARFDEVVALLSHAGPFFAAIAKAKVAKIVRSLLDIVAGVPGDTLELQAALCTRVMDWCRTEKRTFLRQRVECRLVAIDYERERYDEALKLVTTLLFELKKLDDKQMLVETHLMEARIHAALRNVPKAKAALTASRAHANAVYVGPKLQAQLDEMSGTLHCEECDYSTGYSYFLEAFEGFDSFDEKPNATRCLKYMLLCQTLAVPAGGARKVDKNAVKSAKSEAEASSSGTMTSKAAYVKYQGPELECMSEISKAAKARSLEMFELTLTKFALQLSCDVLIKHHIDLLYDRILETNLAKIIEPFSCVELGRVAQLINLPQPRVEKKLAQMILDHKLQGTLAQGTGHLMLHTVSDVDPMYASSIEVIKNMGEVVESLFRRAEALDN